jgi:hypothetical protein
VPRTRGNKLKPAPQGGCTSERLLEQNEYGFEIVIEIETEIENG